MNSQTAVVGRRACAVLAACSAVLHGITIAHAETLAAAVLMAGMGIACLYCACELWIHSARRTWVLVAVMNIAMIAVHTPGASGHQHGDGAVAVMPMQHSTTMTVATVLAAAEAIIATAVVYQRSRHNHLAVSGARCSAVATRIDNPPPLLVVHDPDDPDSPYAMSESLVGMWPGASLVTTRGLGRLAHYRILRHRPAIQAAVDFIGCAPSRPDADEPATTAERVMPH
jgi:hypothetical protein